ncbi:MAG: S41 family peptidase [Cyclobacteriaceae bacterium]
METNHPGLFWYQSNAAWDSTFIEARKLIENGADIFHFNSVLSKINAQIGCGHTSVRLGRSNSDEWTDSLRIVPFTVKLINDKLVINDPLIKDAAINKGSTIKSINGISTEDILNEIAATISMDGFNLTGKHHYIERRFPIYFAKFIQPLAIKFRIDIDGKMIETTGASTAQFEKLANNETQPLLELKPLEPNNTYYMRIATFSSNYMNSRGFNYSQFLSNSFGELSRTNATNLVLDLRGNGGGDDGNGSLLMSYLVNDEFDYYRSIEVTPAYDGWGDVKQSPDGRYLLTAHNDLSSHQPKSDNFNGNVYILIDGGSFSATSEFAALIHNRKRATFIGVETGGGYYGNSSGNRKRLELPNTKLAVSIPYWRYQVAIDGDQYYGRGIIPDYPIKPTIDNLLNGEDLALKKAIELIGAGQ